MDALTTRGKKHLELPRKIKYQSAYLDEQDHQILSSNVSSSDSKDENAAKVYYSAEVVQEAPKRSSRKGNNNKAVNRITLEQSRNDSAMISNSSDRVAININVVPKNKYKKVK